MDSLFGLTVSLALFINAALFIPQGYKILKQKSAKNVSLVTYIGFNLVQLVILIHSYRINDYQMMVGYLVSFISCGVVTILATVYRNKN